MFTFYSTIKWLPYHWKLNGLEFQPGVPNIVKVQIQYDFPLNR